MRNRGVWIAFLVTCFALTGLVGLFASYGAAIPLERGLHRESVLDLALAGPTPDRNALRAAFDPKTVSDLLDLPGDRGMRAAGLRAQIRREAIEEQAAVAARIRLLVVVVTVLSGAVGVGLLLISGRARPG